MTVKGSGGLLLRPIAANGLIAARLCITVFCDSGIGLTKKILKGLPILPTHGSTLGKQPLRRYIKLPAR